MSCPVSGKSSDCAPTPSFSKLGKSARDLFSEVHIPEKFQVKAKTLASENLEVKFTSVHSIPNKTIATELHSIIKLKYLTLEEKWLTSNCLDSKACFTHPHLPNAKAELNSLYYPAQNKCKPTFLLSYGTPILNVDLSVTKEFSRKLDLSADGAVFDTSAVLNFNNIMLGSKAQFLQNKGIIPATTKFAASYRPNCHTEIHASIADFSGLDWSVYMVKSQNLKLAATAKYITSKETADVGLGAIVTVDPNTTVYGKLSSNMDFGLTLKHVLNKHTDLVLSSSVNLTKLDQPGHKFGLGIEVNA